MKEIILHKTENCVDCGNPIPKESRKSWWQKRCVDCDKKRHEEHEAKKQ